MNTEIINLDDLNDANIKKIEDYALAGSIETYRGAIQIILKHFTDYQLHQFNKLVKWAFPEGTLIFLEKMLKDERPIQDMMFGTVHCVDDQGTVHTYWEEGRKLGLIVNVDKFKVIE